MTWVLETAPIPEKSDLVGAPTRTALTMVLLGMANHADRHGHNAFCSLETLADYGRMSKSTVQRCISVLLEVGLITRGDQAIPRAHLKTPNPPKNYSLSMHLTVQDEPTEPVDNSPIQRGQVDQVTNDGPVQRGQNDDSTWSKTQSNVVTADHRTVHEPPIEPLLFRKASNSLAADPDERRFIPNLDTPAAATPAEIEQANREQRERNARGMARPEPNSTGTRQPATTTPKGPKHERQRRRRRTRTRTSRDPRMRTL